MFGNIERTVPLLNSKELCDTFKKLSKTKAYNFD